MQAVGGGRFSSLGNGDMGSTQNHIEKGRTPDDQGKTSSVVGASISQTSLNAGANSMSDQPDSNAGNEASVVRITLPKDGQYRVVVVGSSAMEERPEIAEIWGRRLAYSVYLQVGLSKNWILQYSLPRDEEAVAGGNAGHLEAPWPYEIVRSNLANPQEEAIMVHGFVTTEGHLDQLAIVFPPQLAQASILLSALKQWQFRPAFQNGRQARVEVLLIIPAEEE